MNIQDWGQVEYAKASARQLLEVERVAEGGEDQLIFCSHPPVVTMGRGASCDDLMGWQGQVEETSRGGRATYHGPGQIVIYPILDLRREGFLRPRARDIHSYLRSLEEWVVGVLLDLKVPAEARTTETINSDGSKLSLTGVWVREKKVASIGIAVRKWVSYHGIALNTYPDGQAFSGIRPCGFSRNVMMSLSDLEGVQVPPRGELIRRFTSFYQS